MLAEKYRPRTFDELIDQEEVKESIRRLVEAVKSGGRDLPHMLFVGPPGTGKTTMAHIIARELGWPIVELNASDERGIDVIRGKVKRLAFSAGRRIILLDEADSLTIDAQEALRRIMEKSSEARFILTANYPEKLIYAIKSRTAIYVFKPLPRDQVLRRLIEILRAEGVRIPREKLGEAREALRVILDMSQGDMRKALNLLEEVIASGAELSPEAVRGLVAPTAALEAVRLAVSGDLDGAVDALEELLVRNRLDLDVVVNQLYTAIRDEVRDPAARARAWASLARAEHAVKMGGSPLIQLTGFIADLWLAVVSGAGRGAPGGGGGGNG